MKDGVIPAKAGMTPNALLTLHNHLVYNHLTCKAIKPYPDLKNISKYGI